MPSIPRPSPSSWISKVTLRRREAPTSSCSQVTPFTPPTSRNVLPGVSLLTVRELAPQLGYDFVEKDLQPYDVVNADEAWLPTTPYCLAPATRINGTPIGSGKPGPGFSRVMAAWSDLVGLDIIDQIRRSAR